MQRFDISIAGEVNLDLILGGLPTQMAEERELIASAFTVTLGASSAIVAHNAACLGAKVAFSALVGGDDLGRIALQRLSAAGVDLTDVKSREDLQTGVTVLLPHGETRHMFTYPGTMEVMRTEDVNLKQLRSARHFHLSSLYLQKGMHSGLPSLLRQLKEAGLSISLDTNDDPKDAWGEPLHELFPYVDCFLPNESEICRMMRCSNIEDALDSLPQKIPLVAVKRGRLGARVRAEGTRFDVAPVPVTPLDTIGAGDSFDAGFLYAYLAGKDADTCARAGNIAGALSTLGHGGTESFRNRELRERFLKEHGFDELVGREAAPD